MRLFSNSLKSLVTNRDNRVAFIVSCLLLLILVTATFAIQEWYRNALLNQERDKVQAEIAPYSEILAATLHHHIALLQEVEAMITGELSEADVIRLEEFTTVALEITRQTNDVRKISVAPNGVERFIYPPPDSSRGTGVNLLRNSEAQVSAAIQTVINTEKVALSGPFTSADGSTLFTAWKAVNHNGDFWGLVSIEYDLSTILIEAGMVPAPENLRFTLVNSQSEVLTGPENILNQSPVKSVVAIPDDGVWTLAGIPSGGWNALIADPLRTLNIGMVLLILFSTGGVFYLVRRHSMIVRKQQRTKDILQQIWQYSMDGILLINQQGIIKQVNPTAAQILGYSPEYLNGLSIYNPSITPAVFPLEEFPARFSAGTIPEFIKHSITGEQGKQKTITFHNTFINTAGDGRLLLSTLRDITDMDMTRQALKRSKERYQTFFNETLEGIYRLDLEQPLQTDLSMEDQVDFLYDHAFLAEANTAFAKMYGVEDPGQLIGQRLVDFHGGRNHPQNQAIVRLFIKNNYRVSNAETTEIGVNGEKKVFSNTTIGILENGNLMYIWGTQLDITEQKSLETRAQKLSRIVHESLNEVYIIDAESLQFKEINRSAQVNLGYTREKMLHMHPWDIKPEMTREDFKTLVEPLLTHKKEQVQFKGNHRRSDGSTYVVEANLEYTNFEGPAFVAIASDITDELTMENALRSIASSYASLTGREFFKAVSKHIAENMNLAYVFVGVLLPSGDVVRAVGGYAQGEWIDEFEYDLAGTPCNNVIDKTLSVYPEGIQEQFPKDELLREMGVEGYIGSPLFDNEGNALGILVGLSTTPIQNQQLMENYFQVFVDRVSSEILRSQTEEVLKNNQHLLKMSQEMAHLGSWIYDFNTDTLTWTEEVYKIFGRQKREFTPTYQDFLTMVHDDDRALVDNTFMNSIANNEDTYVLEHRIIKADTGAIRWVQEKSHHYKDESGTIVKSVGMVQDITERKETEQQLKQSENRFRQMFQQHSAVKLLIDPEQKGKIVDVNESALDFYGYSAEQMTSMSINDINTLPASEVEKRMENARIRGRNRFEFQHQLADGSVREVEVYSSQVRVDGRAILYSIVHDITDRNRIQRKLEESEERFRSLYENTTIGLYRTTPEGKILLANPTLVEMLGYDSFETLKQRNLNTEGFHPDYPRDEFLSWFNDKDIIASFESVWHTKDGTDIIVRESARAVRDNQGNILYIDGTVEDITSQYQQAKESRRLQHAITQAGEAIIITDVNGRITYVNPAFEDITGYTKEEVLGETPSLLKSGEHDNEFYQQLWAAISQGKTWEGRFTNRRKSGEIFYEDAVISPVKDDAGDIINYVAVKRDITKQISLENQLRQSQKMEAVGRLAGGVAHDFNNLLTVIRGYANVLAADMDDSDLQDMANMIVRAGEQAGELTSQLLAFSRKQDLKPKPVNPNILIEDSLKMIQRLVGEDIALDFRPVNAIRQINIDPVQFEQVLMNLAVNSRDAMPTGGHIGIETDLCQSADLPESSAQFIDSKSDELFYIAFSDTGEGMDSETIEQVFDPFFTTKQKGKGTGLGLSTVFGIVKQSGGNIEVKSTPGDGTSFHMYFPIIEPKPAQDVKKDSINVVKLEGVKILVLDDDENIARFVKMVLELHNVDVETAHTGAEALEKLRKASTSNPFDLLLTDVILSESSGPEIADKCRNIHPDLGVVLMTGYPDERVAQYTSENHAITLHKPFQVEDLLVAIRGVLNRNEI